MRELRGESVLSQGPRSRLFPLNCHVRELGRVMRALGVRARGRSSQAFPQHELHNLSGSKPARSRVARLYTC